MIMIGLKVIAKSLIPLLVVTFFGLFFWALAASCGWAIEQSTDGNHLYAALVPLAWIFFFSLAYNVLKYLVNNKKSKDCSAIKTSKD